jgi:hypothetical protein
MASGTSREVSITVTSSGTATATYTNSCGAQSTQTFNITVSGGGSSITYVTIKNRATGLLIDGMGSTSAGSHCAQYTGSGSWNQMWALETSGSYVYIKNRNTGLYIDGRGTGTNGEYASQWTSSTSNNLQWQQETVGSYVKLKNRATGLYLDGMGRTSNGSDLGQWSNSSSNNQQWTITTLKSSQITEEITAIANGETVSQIQAYPNPFTSSFSLNLDPEKVIRVAVYNMTGKLVENVEKSDIKGSMTLGSMLKSNMYIVKIYGENQTKSFKIVKK